MSSKFFASIYTKIAYAAVLVFVGVASGMYVGEALTGHPESVIGKASAGTRSKAVSALDEQVVSFDVGDVFPPEEFIAFDGTMGNFAELLAGRNTLLLFVTLDCDPCHRLLRFMKEDMAGRVRDDVQLVVCVMGTKADMPVEYASLFAGVETVFYKGSYWANTYDLKIWPVVFGTDQYGIVQHIQFGFRGYMDFELVQEFFTPGG